MPQRKVAIIGAGIAGLTCGLELQKAGYKVSFFEKSDRVGGRIKTDSENGFLLDHGFQVLLTAYPEARQYLDYNKLDLQYFNAGAISIVNRKKLFFADPLQHPTMLLKALLSPIGSLGDKLKLLGLKRKLSKLSSNDIFEQEEIPAYKALMAYGFSSTIMRNFFGPFLSGIFLEKRLETSRRMLDFVFNMFTQGKAAIPANGMQAIPLQLKEQLQSAEFHFKSEFLEWKDGKVILQGGREENADFIVYSSDFYMNKPDENVDIKHRIPGVYNLYFKVKDVPVTGPWLILTPDSKLINNLCFVDEVAKSYADSGHLLSVSVVEPISTNEEVDLQQLVKIELANIFGNDTKDWEFIKLYHIPKALPNQYHVREKIPESELKLAENTYVTGDHLLYGSLNAAFLSGRMTAEKIISDHK